MENNCNIRLKINLVNIEINEKKINKNNKRVIVNDDKNNENYKKFMYFLNKNKIQKIDEFKNDLIIIFNKKFNLNYDKKNEFNIYVDDYIVPNWETTSVLRDNDILM